MNVEKQTESMKIVPVSLARRNNFPRSEITFISLRNHYKSLFEMYYKMLSHTTPFCTLKPSWYLTSGRLMRTSTTGGQGTTVNFTTVWFFVACNRNQQHKKLTTTDIQKQWESESSTFLHSNPSDHNYIMELWLPDEK